MAKKERKATTRGRAISPIQRELIVQAYALCGNKRQVSREIGCTAQTVSNVLKIAETDRSLQKARKSALEDVAGRLHNKTIDIIDSITPSDMESGLIKTYNDDGSLKSVKAWGSSLLQKVTSAAILTDKLKVIEDTKLALMGDNSGDPLALPMPEDVQSALQMLGGKIKRLRMIDVQFDRNHSDVANKVQDVALAASLHDQVDEADFEDLVAKDWDNP